MVSATTILSSAYAAVTTVVTTAAPFDLELWQASVLWILIASFFIAFVLAFAVGANDVANSFGTTVGAGTLTLKQACILASIFETLGAILLGAKVGATIRKGIIDVDIYVDNATLLMVGEISAMCASGLWQLIATFFKIPVSGTHSIVGATVGFSLVAKGLQGVNWKKMGLIVGSWFCSPVLAGGMAAIFYYLLRKLIFQKKDPVRPGLIAMPIMYGCTIAINCFSVLFSGAPLLGFDKLSPWVDVIIAIAIGLGVALLVQLVMVKKMKAAIKAEKNDISNQVLLVEKETPSAHRKPCNLPTVMESIAEKDTPDGSFGALNENGLGDEGLPNGKPASDLQHNQSANEITDKPNKRVRIHSDSHKLLSPQTFEEAKFLRQHFSKRSKSVGQESHSSVRIPPLLQLEKGVMKTSIPTPSIHEIKEEIRRNFSEPAMVTLTEKSDADVYEVFINRQRKMITIHRKRTTSCDPSDNAFSNMKGGSEGSGLEVEHLSSALLASKLDEPFEDSDEEGLVMNEVQSSENLPSSYSNIYSGAIEEGFRRLSTAQQDVIAIKIGNEDEAEKPKEMTKDDIMEAQEGRMEIRKIFSFLQILTACFGSFAHGGNDVSNAIGPLIAIWIIYHEGAVHQKSYTPLLILLYGGVGICCGLWVWGRRVIKTMGKDLTNLTPSRGFAIELMSAITVLAASNSGLPVSTTHCKVGAVVAVGWVRSREAVDWKIFRNIVVAWFITVPISGGLSALIFLVLRAAAGLDT